MSVLDEAIRHAGSVSKLARCIGVSCAVVTNWRQRGIPVERVLAVAAATRWRVTPHEINQELYPHPLDGLPTERRGCECAAQGAI